MKTPKGMKPAIKVKLLYSTDGGREGNTHYDGLEDDGLEDPDSSLTPYDLGYDGDG